MDGLRVALRTLSVECRLIRVGDPRPYWHQSPFRRCCGHNLLAGRCPGAPKWVPGQGRAGGAAGGELVAVALGDLQDFLPDGEWVQQRFVEQNHEAP